MLKLSTVLLIVTATSTALMAGLFFAWSFSVTIGIARLSDSAYITAFQAMNRAIQNFTFLACFIGTLLLLPLVTYLHYTPNPSGRFWFLLAASILYAAGVFGVTMFGNVPMNEALDKFPLQTASLQEIAAQRARFEVPWNRLNMVRTVVNTLCVVCIIIACLIPENKKAANARPQAAKHLSVRSALILLIMIFCGRAMAAGGGPADGELKKAALTVLENKCNVCHQQQHPGKVFTGNNMENLAPRIYKQVFVKKRMPKGDKIRLTETEAQQLKSWLETQLPS